MALGIGVGVGFVNGLAIGVFRVNPLIMTLGMASVLLGIITVGLRGWLAGSTNVLDLVRDVGSGNALRPAAGEPHRLARGVRAARAGGCARPASVG